MNFTGCGEITDWTIVGVGGGGFGDIDRIIELQLFRHDPTRSTVFTKVTSSVVTTNFPHNQLLTHTFTSIEFTFSPGDVLGFYYDFNNVAILEVRHTNSCNHLNSNCNTTPALTCGVYIQVSMCTFPHTWGVVLKNRQCEYNYQCPY